MSNADHAYLGMRDTHMGSEPKSALWKTYGAMAPYVGSVMTPLRALTDAFQTEFCKLVNEPTQDTSRCVMLTSPSKPNQI